MDKVDRIQWIVDAYDLQATMNGDAPIHPFGKPFEWLQGVCEVEEAITIAKEQGITFITPAPDTTQALDEDMDSEDELIQTPGGSSGSKQPVLPPSEAPVDEPNAPVDKPDESKAPPAKKAKKQVLKKVKVEKPDADERDVPTAVVAASVIDRKTFGSSSNAARRKMLKAAYESIGATQAFTPMFGEPNAWLNELMYRDFHLDEVHYLRKYSSLKILIGKMFPPAPILIDRKSFGQSSEENQAKKIKQAYKAIWDFEDYDEEGAMLEPPKYIKFGEPSAWLNDKKYSKLHEQVIGIMKGRGMVFTDDEEVPMHE